jgi:hypothetical protein
MLESDNVLIENIHLSDAPHADIFYNAATGKWTANGAPTRLVDPEHLIIENRVAAITAAN